MKYLAAVPTDDPATGGTYVPPKIPIEGIYNPAINPKVGSGGGTTIVGTMISRIISILLIVGTLVCLIYLIMGAIMWITSGGEKAKVEEARSKISYAVMGLVLLATSWAVMLLLQHFLGLSIFGGEGFTLPTP